MHKTVTKTTKAFVFAAACSALFVSQAFAQSQETQEKHCGSTIMEHRLYDMYPGLEEEAQRKHTQSWVDGQNNRAIDTTTVYTIPVVFHIIHDYGAENISDAQILDQMMILNRDYRKQNADTSVIVAPFPPIAADIRVEFRLAQIDPEGNCTNGIDRIASMETYVGDDGSKLNRWPREKYLNVWVVKSMMDGVAGYAYYPGAVDGFLYPFDGVIILQDYIGSIGTSIPLHSRALTHEIGHYLSLPHVWGSTNSPGVACGDEGITDTPETKGWTTCPTPQASKVCDTAVVENYQNYMDYSYCSVMFTRGQRDAMRFALNSSVAHRNNLWSASNLVATGVMNTQSVCAPHADFDINRTMVCEGGSITLTDLSWTSSATAWQWTLTGPATLTSTSQNPTFSNLTVPGSYNVQLIATNASGTDTLTKYNYFTVGADQATFTSLYQESFETPNVYYLGYISNNRYGNASMWHQESWAAYTGQWSSMLNNYGNCVNGDVDELITPSYDLRFNSNMVLSFRYAYATSATSADLNTQVFKVWSSVDCGQNWSPRWTVSNSNVATAGFCSGFYIPTSQADWREVTINLPASFSSQPNVRFKFEFTSPDDGVANNLYIDDINIFTTNVGVNENSNDAMFSVYPNPGDGSSTISYALDKQANVKCEVFDIAGRCVSAVDKGEQAAGNYTMSLTENGTLAPGTYMVRMTIGDKVSTQKYVSASHE